MDNNDMDDLFGGLPAVSKTENLNPVNKKTPAATSTTVKKTVAMPTSVVSGEKKTLPEKRTMGGTSLVRSLGTAGTAMVSSLCNRNQHMLAYLCILIFLVGICPKCN